jgi:transcriptional accessory protein Tex/SPT6
LGQLLLAPPLGRKRILAIDPGFRSGCKIVCLDEKGFAVQRDHLSTRPKRRGDGDEENPFYGQFI